MKKLILIFLLFLLVAQTASAFDGKRDGFVMGATLGMDYFTLGVNRSVYANTWSYNDYVRNIIAPDIGITVGGVSNQKHLVTIGFRLSLNQHYIADRETPFVSFSSYPNISYSYLFKSNAPSIFINFDLGFAAWRGYPKKVDIDGGAVGLTIGTGVGYEFKKHCFARLGWSIFANQAIISYSDSPIRYRTRYVSTVNLSFGVWAY